MAIHDSPAERRQHARVLVEFRVTMSLSGPGKTGEGRLLNLSEGGCAVEGNVAVSPGAFLTLRIHVPGDDPIVVDSAWVKWIRRLDFGVEFRQVTDHQRERLKRFLEGRLASDPSVA